MPQLRSLVPGSGRGLIAWRVKQGIEPCSAETGAYCIARARIPEAACQKLARRTGRELDDAAHLRCKQPNRDRNEVFMHFTAYNLIRRFMALAAWNAGQPPWTVSFKGTLQTLNRLLPVLTRSNAIAWFDALLTAIASHVVGNRPDRIEPRVLKRRPKHYYYLREPRSAYQKRILATR